MKINIKMNKGALRQLSDAQKKALAMTTEAVKDDVVKNRVMPFGENTYKEQERVGKKGQALKPKKVLKHQGGDMQNHATYIDTSKLKKGRMSIASDTPYARRLYFHPEYNFNKKQNPNAKGRWYDDWIDGSKKDFAPRVYKKLYKKLTGV
jgi:hypothetical protein